jgi:hypothetical protein
LKNPNQVTYKAPPLWFNQDPDLFRGFAPSREVHEKFVGWMSAAKSTNAAGGLRLSTLRVPRFGCF